MAIESRRIPVGKRSDHKVVEEINVCQIIFLHTTVRSVFGSVPCSCFSVFYFEV